MTSDEQSIRECVNRKGHEGLFKATAPIPTLQRVKCQTTRAVTEAQKNKKTCRDYKLSEVTYEYGKMFRDCVKRKGQVKVYKKENQKGFLSLDDFIRNDNGLNKVILSYFKEVKIRELRIWKGDAKHR